MFKLLSIAAFLCLPLIPHYAYAKSFEDCILANMKGVTSDEAARLIAHSCAAKFPDSPTLRPAPVPTPESEKRQVSVQYPPILDLVKVKIKERSEYGTSAFEIFNESPFNYHEVRIGILKKGRKSCDRGDISAFQSINICRGSYLAEATTTGYCSIVIPEGKFVYCITQATTEEMDVARFKAQAEKFKHGNTNTSRR